LIQPQIEPAPSLTLGFPPLGVVLSRPLQSHV
jgi:hypothetical protein